MNSNNTRLDGRGALPWKTVGRSREFALSIETVMRLGELFEFQEDNLLSLSMNLAKALKMQRYSAHDFAFKQKKGKSTRATLIQKLKRIRTELRDVSVLVDSLEIYRANPDINTKAHIARLRIETTPFADVVAATLSALEESERTCESVFDRKSVNRSKARDEKRISIVNEVMMFWEEQGRPLTLTTRSDGRDKPRGGQLYEFANLVVMDITEPSTELNSETFRSDLQRVRKRSKESRETIIELLEADGY